MQHAVLPLSCRLSVPVSQSTCPLPLRTHSTHKMPDPRCPLCRTTLSFSLRRRGPLSLRTHSTHKMPDRRCPLCRTTLSFFLRRRGVLEYRRLPLHSSSPHYLGLCQFSTVVVATSVILILARLDAVLPTRNISARCFVPYGILVNNFSIYLSVRFFNNCRRLPETKHHSSLFLH